MSVGAAVMLMRRLKARSTQGGVRLIAVSGHPAARRRGVMRLTSDREAMIGDDYFIAEETETVSDFHTRLRAVARDRGVRIVVLGCPGNLIPPPGAPLSQ